MTGEIGTEIVLDHVVGVVSAAVSLGAVGRGGDLSAQEMRLVEWARRRPPLSKPQVEHLREMILAGDDPLGDTLIRLRSQEDRRKTGSFYTPSTIVAPMVEWVLAQNPETVVDPGCGSGRFAATVARLSPETRLIAVDKDAHATLVTRAILAVLKPRYSTVINTDFLTMPSIPRTPGRRIGWIGNPPYVRHQLTTRAQKKRGVAMAAMVGHESLMTVGLHALFFTKTKLLAEAGDIGCYVTPSEWIDNRSGRIVRDLFMNGLGGESVVTLDPGSFAFAGVKVTAAITSFVVGSESKIRRFAFDVQVADLAKGLRTIGQDIETSALTTTRGWSRVVGNPTGMPDTGPTIGDLFHVHRGTATGTNGYWVMTRGEAKERGLSKYAVPTITRAEEIISAVGELKKSPELKVTISFPKMTDRKEDRDVDAFIRCGERADENGLIVSQGSNAQKRSKPWWSISMQRPAIVATYMARRPPTFAANPDNVAILNIAIGLDPKVKMDAAAIAIVVKALNGAAPDFDAYAVTYFGNLRKFEPKTVISLPLPAALHHLLPQMRTLRF